MAPSLARAPAPASRGISASARPSAAPRAPFSVPSRSLAAARRSRAPPQLARAEDEKKEGGNFYNDERPLPPRSEMSDEYKKKLRDEYLSLGGSPNTAMGSNYFLWIGVVIGTLAVLSWLTGAI